MFLMSLCSKCAETLKGTHYLAETGAPQRVAQCSCCVVPNVTALTQYELTPKHMPRRRAKQGGLQQRDTRARYRGNWRDEEKAEGW